MPSGVSNFNSPKSERASSDGDVSLGLLGLPRFASLSAWCPPNWQLGWLRPLFSVVLGFLSHPVPPLALPTLLETSWLSVWAQISRPASSQEHQESKQSKIFRPKAQEVPRPGN